MTGHVRRRGARSWELKFDLGTDPRSGRRITRYRNFKGAKREAELELAKLVARASSGDRIDPSRTTVAEFFETWKSDWARQNLGGKTFERYAELIGTDICPRLGSLLIQKLRPSHLVGLYAELQRSGRKRHSGGKAGTGLSASTVAYSHRILHRALGHACAWGLISVNPAASVRPPKSTRAETKILSEEQVREVLRKLRGRSMYLLAALGLATGMRRGELLALRWADIDFDAVKIRIERSLEQTRAGVRVKRPKTKHGVRGISVSLSVLAELRAHRRKQAENRLALGLGRDSEEGLVFQRMDGTPLLPNSVTTEWRRLVKVLQLPPVTLHAWRHTHASQLIASGMDVLTISRRLGHSSPSITLDVYGHLFSNSDASAATVFERAFGAVLTE